MNQMDSAKGEPGSLKRALQNLPGIKGYRDKELRRAADKQVRDMLAQRLEEQRRHITAAQQELLSSGGMQWLADLERVGSRVQLLVDRVRTASYGYAPFFDLQQVKEAELDRLIQFDQSLLADMLPKLEEAVANLGTAVRNKGDIKAAAQAVGDLAAQMNETFGHRAEAMRAAE